MKYLALFLFVLPRNAQGWVIPTPRHGGRGGASFSSSSSLLSASLEETRDLNQASNNINNTITYSPLFDFSDPDAATKFSRIDDVIMGGVSSSTFLNQPNTDYAKWFGICRTEGGGFCGVRTKPLTQALQVSEAAQGFYLQCRLVSDQEPERRVWKITTRVKPDRGEQLYQARYEFGNKNKNDNSNEDWSLVRIPFDSFKLVRGPRQVPDGPPLNVTGGIYQVGMTMSKFDMGAVNATVELDNFRAGFFEYHLKTIGLYSLSEANDDEANEQSSSSLTPSGVPEIQQNDRQATGNSLLFKVLRLIGKLFFTEQSQRRKAALKLLQQKRGLERWQAIRYYAWQRVAQARGRWSASVRLLRLLATDMSRFAAFQAIKVGIFLPIRLIRMVLQTLTKPFQKAAAAGSSKPTRQGSV